MGLVANHYTAVANGEIRDMVINVPPGTSKSMISCVLFNAWDWIANPWRKFMYVCYDESLSHDFSRRTLDLITSDWYQARWPLKIKRGERAAVHDYWNEKGGRRFSTMIGGAATGVHAHIIVVDDPHKPKDLQLGGDSAKHALEEAWKSWTGTFRTRRADAKSFARVCIMQRLHCDDLAGRMLKDPNVVHLKLPMEFNPDKAYRSKWGNDWRTEAGELLAPQRFPRAEVDADRVAMTARDFAAQMQQEPTAEDGTIFHRDWFNSRWVVPPHGAKWLISVDASNKDKKDSDFTCIQVWAHVGPSFYLVDQACARMAFSAALGAIRAFRNKWPQVSQILIEDKANGPAIVDSLRLNETGVVEVSPEGGKEARAQAVEPLLRALNVHFPPDYIGPWVGELIEQALSFPVGSHDDMVDCMTQALLFMSKKFRSRQFKKAMANARQGHVFR